MSQPPVVGARAATGVGIASLVAAGSGYLMMWLAARSLSQAENADFLAYWALLFSVFGILGGVQNEVTRAIRTAGPGAGGVRVLPAGLAVGTVLAVAAAATSPWWSVQVLGTDPAWQVAALCIGAVAFAGHSTIAGALSGRGRWTTFARLIAAEAITRVSFAGLAVLAGLALGGIEAAAVSGAFAWTAFMLLSAPARDAARARANVTVRGLWSRFAHATVASSASAALMVGFPVLLRLTSTPEVYATSAPLLLAVSLTRAPLLLPLGAYQGVAIAAFVDRRQDRWRPLVKVGTGILGVGLLGAAAAWAIGPWLMALLFGDGYRVDGTLLGGLTLAAALLALLTLTGAAVLALDRHSWYGGGWLTATVVAVVCLVLPGGAQERTLLALALGPLTGAAVHLVGIARAATVQD